MATSNIDELIRQAHERLHSGDRARALKSVQDVRSLAQKRYRDNANAWSAVSALYGMLGDFKESEACARRAVGLQPNLAPAWVNFGNALQSQGRAGDSIDKFKRAIAAGANHAQIHLNLAVALHAVRRMDEAELQYRKALELDPMSIETQAQLGLFLLDHKRPDDALAILQPLANRYPGEMRVMIGVGRALSEIGRLEEALAISEQISKTHPAFEENYLLMGSVNMFLGRYGAAEQSFKRLLNLNPGRFEALLGLAEAYWQSTGRRKEAMECCRQALTMNPDYIPARLSLCNNLITQGDIDEAYEQAKLILQQDPENLTAVGLLGTVLHRKRLYEEARQLLLPYIDRGAQDVNIALAFSDISRPCNLQAQAVSYIEACVRARGLQQSSKRVLMFALGNLYDALGEYDLAFERYQEANKLKGAVFDIDAHRHDVDGIIEFFTKPEMATLQKSSLTTELPIFVVGMPRSGTTLVEQILSRHTMVFGAGELVEISNIARELFGKCRQAKDYAQLLRTLDRTVLDAYAQDYLTVIKTKGGDARRIVDKMPGNYLYLGLINLLFPAARVIHCCRDARDTSLSQYFQDFGGYLPYAYDLSSIGAVHVQYQRLMGHWATVLDIQMLDVSYEALVQDQEAESRRLVEFCGLNWEENCLRFYESDRQIATRSYDQVRRPIYNSSIGKWKRYARHLSPLLVALSQNH